MRDAAVAEARTLRRGCGNRRLASRIGRRLGGLLADSIAIPCGSAIPSCSRSGGRYITSRYLYEMQYDVAVGCGPPSSEPAATPGGELLRLIDAHPTLELAAARRRRRMPGSGLGRRAPTAGRPWPTGRWLTSPTPELADADLVFLALPHGASAAAVDSLAPDALVVDLGADFRLADRGGVATLVPRRPCRAPGPTACPSCRAPATRIAGGPAGRQPRLLRDRGRARRSPRCSRRGASRPPTSSWSRRAAPPAPAGAPAGSCWPARSWATSPPTRLAAPISTSARCSSRCGCRRRRCLDVVHPDARPDAARHPGHLHRTGRHGRDGR